MDTSHTHANLYYPDGNIVFCCRAKDNTPTYFRIHRSYIASHSSVIGDMISVPSPHDGQQLYDGVPMVYFSADPGDMEKFLNFFYQPGNDYLSQEDPDIAYKMYGVIRLADMLEVHPLKERILSRIKQDWLSIKSAQDWTRKLQFYRSFEPEDEYDPDKYTLEPASVLRVAREFDSSLITPVLFYFLASCESHAIHGNFEEEERGIRLKSAARWDLMSSTDRVKVMEGHSAILDWVSMELDSLDLECANHQTKCRAVLRSTLRSVYKTILRGIDPLRALMLSRSHHFETSIMCKTCAHTWNLNLNVFREKLFDQLEDIFDTIHN